MLSSRVSGYAATYTIGAGLTPIVYRVNLAITDADDVNTRSASVTLLDRPNATAERLSVDVGGTTILAPYDAQTRVLNLRGPATKAAFQQVLRTATYNNLAASPSIGDRRVMTFVVNDGSTDSKAATSMVSLRGAN